jgi:ABC-type dipeptide/oligopeptide/nickel transport system ATPase component
VDIVCLALLDGSDHVRGGKRTHGLDVPDVAAIRGPNDVSSIRRLLDVRDLSVAFGRTLAVDRVSFSIKRGECVALVGESGSGKSVSALSILKLLPYPAASHPSGSIRFNGRELLTAAEHEMREIRGNDISIIFQEPMTSLNPLHTIEAQIGEILLLHSGITALEVLAGFRYLDLDTTFLDLGLDSLDAMGITNIEEPTRLGIEAGAHDIKAPSKEDLLKYLFANEATGPNPPATGYPYNMSREEYERSIRDFSKPREPRVPLPRERPIGR